LLDETGVSGIPLNQLRRSRYLFSHVYLTRTDFDDYIMGGFSTMLNTMVIDSGLVRSHEEKRCSILGRISPRILQYTKSNRY